MLPSVARVRGRRRETHDTWTLEIDAGEFGFAPGQFAMLYAFGVGEIPVSVSGGPGRAGALVHTIRAVGAVSAALTRLRPGDALGLRGASPGTGFARRPREGSDNDIPPRARVVEGRENRARCLR
jgi:NAD(P)H-flavin reductase